MKIKEALSQLEQKAVLFLILFFEQLVVLFLILFLAISGRRSAVSFIEEV